MSVHIPWSVGLHSFLQLVDFPGQEASSWSRRWHLREQCAKALWGDSSPSIWGFPTSWEYPKLWVVIMESPSSNGYSCDVWQFSKRQNETMRTMRLWGKYPIPRQIHIWSSGCDLGLPLFPSVSTVPSVSPGHFHPATASHRRSNVRWSGARSARRSAAPPAAAERRASTPCRCRGRDLSNRRSGVTWMAVDGIRWRCLGQEI